jgi:hypothetical protein
MSSNSLMWLLAARNQTTKLINWNVAHSVYVFRFRERCATLCETFARRYVLRNKLQKFENFRNALSCSLSIILNLHEHEFVAKKLIPSRWIIKSCTRTLQSRACFGKSWRSALKMRDDIFFWTPKEMSVGKDERKGRSVIHSYDAYPFVPFS